MSSSRRFVWPIATILIGGYLLLLSLPNQWKPFAPSFLQPTLHLGLDLQGGTQLDFRISEAEIQQQIADLQAEIEMLERTNGLPEEIDDKKTQISNIQFLRRNLVESIRTVLERRINNLGVSEAVITPSYYGNEKHLLVECPGIVDIQKCISTVGKTILLEFKEQFEGADEEQEAKMRKLSEKAFARITESEETLKTIGQDLGPTLGVFFAETTYFEEDIPIGLEDLWNRTTDQLVISREITLDVLQRGDELIINSGIMLAEVTGEKAEGDQTISDPTEAIEFLGESNKDLTLVVHENVPLDELDRGLKLSLGDIRAGILGESERADGTQTVIFIEDYSESREEMDASHILIAYAGAVRADQTVTRSRAEAQTLAEDLELQLEDGAGFSRLAREHSDGPSGSEGGSLGTIGRGEMTPVFEETAFALSRGELSDVIETEFGFHIVRADSTPEKIEGSLSYLELLMGGEDVETLQLGTLEALRNNTVFKKEIQLPVRTLYFSFLPTGWKDTALDGKHFRRATVTTDPLTGIPVVQILFDSEGGDLFYELTKRNIGRPIAIFVGGEIISAPTVQSEIPGGIAIITGSRNFDEANTLAQDLNTGAIPAPIHLVGQVTVEASLGAAALKQSLNAALLGFLLVGIYMIWYYRVLGVIAAIALLTYAIIFTALLKLPLFLLSSQHVVLTLAGIAGIILSVGMAVDANVLIFERMKEELKKGKLLETAADTGFKRAWSSIRDSNVSTLLTATILFIIGTSIVRGFAVTLSLGILISLFTAIVVTRFLIRQLYKSPIADNVEAFGVKRSIETTPLSPPSPPHHG